MFPIEAAISNLVEEGETIFTVILRDVTLRERSDILIAKFSRWTMSSEMRSVSSALFCLAWMLPVVGRISHSPVADYWTLVLTIGQEAILFLTAINNAVPNAGERTQDWVSKDSIFSPLHVGP